ncbi:endocuticle structural glycoprotein SgAbd-2 [Dendroctonus ponderosae]|uniref:Uncharacterized protein n=1 Tax=Dendroctonus ponderosae TaxID=77166 RepID=A0AAR5NWQ3_DENPD|nr:endocuticle structural glycoprotein SgAbd-2 [Dendroctonus ponderosae]
MRVSILAFILGFIAYAYAGSLYLPPFRSSSSGGSIGGPQPNGGFGAQTYSSNSAKQIPILTYNADNSGEGSYRYNYETGNSITAEEQGEARGDGTKAHGSYSYISPEGEHISITYTADENGFVAQGSHIPTPPPIPEAILKSLQENAAAEARGVVDDGQYRGEGLSEGQYRGEGQGSSFRRPNGGSGGTGGSGGYAANGGYRY